MTIRSTNFSFPGQTGVYKGKVRDVYTIGKDILVAVATDRVSAFDVILPQEIPHKGQVLNQLAGYFLQNTADIAPNWLLSTPDPNVSIGRKCQPIAIEMVIRSCLVGHAWRTYESGQRELCGVRMPDGLQEYDSFPEPIITPATKAQSGHDEDISAQAIIEQGILSQAQFEKLADLTKQLFTRGQQAAQERGLVLADTKYEFGIYKGQIYVIDEVHTPDSSRYFYADSYNEYLKDRSRPSPKHLSKEFLRQWLLDQGFSGQPNKTVPDLDDAMVDSISKRYIELYEQLTGKTFQPANDKDPLSRIEKNVTTALEEIK